MLAVKDAWKWCVDGLICLGVDGYDWYNRLFEM